MKIFGGTSKHLILVVTAIGGLVICQYFFTGIKSNAYAKTLSTNVVAVKNSSVRSIKIAPGEDIQTAINALPQNGGILQLLEGLHEVTNNIIIPDNVTIEGVGPATVIKLKSGSYSSLTYKQGIIINKNFAQLPGNKNILLRDFTVDGNKDNQNITQGNTPPNIWPNPLSVINFSGVSVCRIDGVHVKNGYSGGIVLSPINEAPYLPLNAIVSNNFVKNCGSGVNNAHSGLFLNNAYGKPQLSIFSGNIVQKCDPYGIVIEGRNANCIVKDNTSSKNTNYGIVLDNASSVTIMGNICEGNGIAGIWSGNDSKDNSITGNLCINGNNYGIYAEDTRCSSIVDNICSLNKDIGIYSKSCLTTITANNCQGNGTAPTPTYATGIVVDCSNDVLLANVSGNDYWMPDQQDYGVSVLQHPGIYVGNMLKSNDVAGLTGTDVSDKVDNNLE